MYNRLIRATTSTAPTVAGERLCEMSMTKSDPAPANTASNARLKNALQRPPRSSWAVWVLLVTSCSSKSSLSVGTDASIAVGGTTSEGGFNGQGVGGDRSGVGGQGGPAGGKNKGRRWSARVWSSCAYRSRKHGPSDQLQLARFHRGHRSAESPVLWATRKHPVRCTRGGFDSRSPLRGYALS